MKSEIDKISNDQFAVVILNFFGYQDTLRCIARVRRSLNAAFFIVDNSAENNEKTKLASPLSDQPHIRLIFPDENLGFAAGVNIALKKAVGAGFKRFLLLNNDAVLLENAGKILNKAFDTYPACLIAPAIKSNNYIYCESYYHKYLGLITQRHISEKPRQRSEKLGWVRYLSGCALAFDKDLLDKIGLLDESFFMYGEDVVFSHRARKSGVPIVLLEYNLVHHKGSHSAKMASFFYEYHMARAHFLLTFNLLSRPYQQVLSLFGKSATLTVRAWIRCFRYRTFAPLAALLLCSLPLRIRPRKSKSTSNILSYFSTADPTP
jgi:N-acetylglucosaminyl-diphospho-decaprenol L-rhamnosyltransferase